MIHQVQIACPPGAEARMRAFYTGVLGWTELPKPPLLAVRGGCWFRRRLHTADPVGNRLEFLAG
ncbi:hypothetical protein ACFYU5_18440 [Nocardia aobensis]|uniref:Glyoxalase n=1 Tax=Nocardia aobensis TaxID=257277 RepID=A0ABW6P559_9NOCA